MLPLLPLIQLGKPHAFPIRAAAWKLVRGLESDRRMHLQISRKLAQESSSVKLTGKDSYALKVSPGVDHAFMLAVVVIVDEMFHD